MTRSASVRILVSLHRRLRKEGYLSDVSAAQFSADFIGLLRGDWFFRAALGVSAPLAQSAVKAEAQRVTARLLRD